MEAFAQNSIERSATCRTLACNQNKKVWLHSRTGREIGDLKIEQLTRRGKHEDLYARQRHA